MSGYALSTHSPLWLAGVLCAGVAMLMVATRKPVFPGGVRGAQFLVIAAISFITLGLFPTDPWYPWQHALTWAGWVHVIATGAGMAALGASMLCDILARGSPGISRTRRLLATSYIAFTVLMGAFMVTLLLLRQDPPLIGLAERVMMTLALLWLAVRAW